MTPKELKRLRKEMGMTQVELAGELGIHERTYQAYEASPMSPRANPIPGPTAIAVRHIHSEVI